MAGATSLIELILKKWGDDIAGAAKELEEKVGFPESVANRIASGELPMDAESVAKRASDQGYSDTMYHGSKSDFIEIDPEMYGAEHGMSTDTGFWASESPDLASTYAGGVVDKNPVIYPVRIKQGDQLEVDLDGSSWQDIDTDARVINNGDDYGSIESWDDSIWDTNELAHMAKGAGADSLRMKNVVDPGDDANVHVELMRMFPELEKMPVGSKERHEFMRNITEEQWQEAKRIGNERAFRPATNVVTFDPNSVRSPNAAFDPEYTGGNIMGGLLAGGVGLGALGQSEEADAGFVTRGGRTLLEAWHGSPHKFDKFSMDQIGTGEGVQQYGHGLYFADSEDVANEYRKLAQLKFDHQGEGLSASVGLRRHVDGDAAAREWLEKNEGDMEAVNGEGWIDLIWEASEEAKSRAAGHLYRTEIDVTPESLLDYDKPLKEQSELVQNFFAGREGITPDTNGRALSESLLKGREPGLSLKELSAIASREMNEAGIRGLQYQDWVNQAEGSDLRNYVIFDDSLINIAERGNADPRLLAGTAAGTAGLLAAPMIKDSGMISAPRSETLFDLTMGARDIERRLEGSLASLLFPSGLVDYLETVNRREEDPNAMTRGMALLDVLPF